MLAEVTLANDFGAGASAGAPTPNPGGGAKAFELFGGYQNPYKKN
jgi:hypothetical protein